MTPAPSAAALEAARRLAGREAQITAITRLEKGTENLGLRLLHLDDGQRLVEKRTASASEFQIAQAVLADQQNGHAPCPAMVRCVHTAEEGGAYLLYTGWLEDVGANSDWLWGCEEMLARSIHTLGLYLDGLYTRHALTRQGPDTLTRLQAALRDDAAACQRLSAIAPVLEAQPPQMGHNDVFWPNFGRAREPGYFAFMDFALVGPNLPGAEFHHFAQQAQKGRDRQAFFQAVTARYAALLAVPVGLVQCGAYVYAAVRAFRRERRRGREDAGRRAAHGYFRHAEAAFREGMQ